MATLKPGEGRKQKRRRRRNPPPPIFNSETPAFRPFNAMSNMSLMSGNCAPQSSVPMNTNEIFDRFNQLLDWRLPGNDNSKPDPFDDVRGFQNPDVDDRNLPSHDDERFFAHDLNLPGKRKITDANDLRNRLDQQHKRSRDIENRKDYDSGYLAEPFDRSCTGQFDLRDNERSAARWAQSFSGDGLMDRSDQTRELFVKENEVPFERIDYSDGRRGDVSVERLEFERRTDRWPDDGNFGSGDRRPPDDRQDFGRLVKEYWPDRNPSDLELARFKSDDRWRKDYIDGIHSSGEMKIYDERRDNPFRQDDFVRGDKEQFGSKDGRSWGENTTELWRRESDPYSEKFSNRYQDMGSRDVPPIDREYNYPRDNYNPGPSSQRRRSPVRGGRPSSPRNLQYDSNNDDLMVIIQKPDLARITFPEVDELRSMLIDLVVTCADEDHMPEFVSSGLMRGGRGFFVNCRTKQSMDWLLKQTLPPLNNVRLSMRRNKLCETVKISAFAPRCTRKRDDILKLIKLQNGKKGFNFDDWTMRSYNTSPSGVYMAFDITLDEARILNELGCQLSFELKTLKFKITVNKN